jgi:negative regulator of flagellin synthesis FlgM
MKIGPTDTKPISQPAAPAAERKGPVASSLPAPVSTPAGEASAKVALSASAQLLATAEPDAGSFDGAKVERISQAIRDGKFVVNAEAIADKLIVNAEELLGKRSS